MSQIRIAALQMGSRKEGTDATLEAIMNKEEAIREKGVDLLVLPEALLGGYPKGSDFSTRVGYRLPEGREQYLEYWQQAIDMDGKELKALSGLAKRCQCNLVVGIIERGGSTLYCTAVFISKQGEITGKHRKLMPTASERLIWGQGDGSTMPVVDSNCGRLATAICWENYMPLYRSHLYSKHPDIWCAPTVDDRDAWQATMRHIALESRTFVVSACQYQGLPSADQAPGWPEGKDLIGGGSVIISPLGEILAGPVYGKEELISADIHLDDIVKARYDFDVVGHYARPDIFQLHVDEEDRLADHHIDPPQAKDN